MARAALLKRLERAEETAKTLSPIELTPFDQDALAIYSTIAYLDATMNPSYDELQPTGVYKRGQELRNAIYGPIVSANDDEHLKRYTRASGEFELAFGREPKADDILRYEHVEKTHRTENYSRELGRMIEAWKRHLQQLTCPLKFEDGRLFRRLSPKRRGEMPTWEEDVRIQPEDRWLSIPQVALNTDFETMRTISAIVFMGVVGAKHQCRPATDEDLQQPETEPPGDPTIYRLGQQRFHEMLVEVMGA
jgi:hypothetical protein